MRMSRFQALIGSGMACASSRMVTPPIGSRMMPFAGMPDPRATRACPNSCSTTLPKTIPNKRRPAKRGGGVLGSGFGARRKDQ